MIDTSILFSDITTREFNAGKRYFKENFTDDMSLLKTKKVILRNIPLNMYRQYASLLMRKGHTLINSYMDVAYLSDIVKWYKDLETITIPTYFRFDHFPKNKQLVLRGSKTSHVNRWPTHMYAPDYTSAIQIYKRLQFDTQIGEETIIARDFVPLDRLYTSKYTYYNEYRVFFYEGSAYARLFQHQNNLPGFKTEPSTYDIPKYLIDRIGETFKKERIIFGGAHIVKLLDGSWKLLKIFDPQRFDLSYTREEDFFYYQLYRVILLNTGNNNDDTEEQESDFENHWGRHFK